MHNSDQERVSYQHTKQVLVQKHQLDDQVLVDFSGSSGGEQRDSTRLGSPEVKFLLEQSQPPTDTTFLEKPSSSSKLQTSKRAKRVSRNKDFFEFGEWESSRPKKKKKRSLTSTTTKTVEENWLSTLSEKFNFCSPLVQPLSRSSASLLKRVQSLCSKHVTHRKQRIECKRIATLRNFTVFQCKAETSFSTVLCRNSDQHVFPLLELSETDWICVEADGFVCLDKVMFLTHCSKLCVKMQEPTDEIHREQDNETKTRSIIVNGMFIKR